MTWRWWDDTKVFNERSTNEWLRATRGHKRHILVEYLGDEKRVVLKTAGPYTQWAVAVNVKPEDSETVIQLTKLRYNL